VIYYSYICSIKNKEVMKLPNFFYVEKTKENMESLLKLGFKIFKSINLEGKEYKVLYVNNTKNKSGMIPSNSFVETNSCKNDGYEYIKLPHIEVAFLYAIDFISPKIEVDGRQFVVASDSINAIKKVCSTLGIMEFTGVTVEKVCDFNNVIQ
tara:strand:+ start:10486 stop:10941 length:456 start_codon:yes stop_codon:yes gene_type:complete